MNGKLPLKHPRLEWMAVQQHVAQKCFAPFSLLNHSKLIIILGDKWKERGIFLHSLPLPLPLLLPLLLAIFRCVYVLCNVTFLNIASCSYFFCHFSTIMCFFTSLQCRFSILQCHSLRKREKSATITIKNVTNFHSNSSSFKQNLLQISIPINNSILQEKDLILFCKWIDL